MASQNINIAYQVREYMLHDTEVSMSLREKVKGEVILFIRNDSLQKFSYEEVTYNMLADDEDENYDEIPKDVYDRMCLLIHSHISETIMDLNHKSVAIKWDYDCTNGKMQNISFTIITEKHFNRR